MQSIIDPIISGIFNRDCYCSLCYFCATEFSPLWLF